MGAEVLEAGNDPHARVAAGSQDGFLGHVLLQGSLLLAQGLAGAADGTEFSVVQQLGCCLALSRYLGNICCEKVVEGSPARTLEPRSGSGVAATGPGPSAGLGTWPLAAPRNRYSGSCSEAGRNLHPAGAGGTATICECVQKASLV